MIKIKWAPYEDFSLGADQVNITHFEPESLFKYIKNNRINSEYLTCPAMASYFKNTYVLKCPYNFTVRTDVKNNRIAVEGINPKYLTISNKTNDIDPMIISFPPRYVFLTNAKKSVTATLLPYFFAPSKVGFVPGSFIINDWIRPQNYGAEVYRDEILEFNRGQPLYCVQFTTADGDTVHLEKTIITPELRLAMTACLNVKRDLPGMNLDALYKMSKDYITLVKNKIFSK